MANPGAAASSIIIARHRHALKRVDFRSDVLILVRRGIKIIGDETSPTLVSPGTILAISRGGSANVTNIPDDGGIYEALAVSFPLETIQTISTSRSSTTTLQRWACIRPEHGLVETMERLHKTLGQARATERLKIALVAELLERLDMEGIRYSLAGASVSEQVGQLLATDPGHAWNIEAAAAHCAMSSSTLRRRLMKDGTTFKALLRELRLERGLGLLQTSTRPIGAIAGDVGFESASKFTAAFRKRYGLLPSLFRGRLSVEEQRLIAVGQRDSDT